MAYFRSKNISRINQISDPFNTTNILEAPYFSQFVQNGNINPPPPTIGELLLENGYALLNEGGGKILLG